MKILGGIYQWTTTHVTGYKNRSKKQIYIRDADYMHGTTFLMINKVDWSPDDYKLIQKDYPAALDYDSYVSVSGFVEYDDHELVACPQQPLAVLTSKHLKELRDRISQTDNISPKDAAWVMAALAHLV